MEKVSIASRLKQIMQEDNLKQIDILNKAKPYCKKYNIKLGRNDISQYVSGKVEPSQNKLNILSKALNINPVWLLGYDVSKKLYDDMDEKKLIEIALDNGYFIFNFKGKFSKKDIDKINNIITNKLSK